jgi:hypothetical protein
VSRGPVAELDAARKWMTLTDDLLVHVGSDPATAQCRAHLQAIGGWLRRHPDVAAGIALNMPGSAA